MKRFFISVLIVAAAMNVADARQRTLAEMKAAAQKVMAPCRSGARNGDALKILAGDTQLSLVGFEDGCFAVIANDDMFPPVLGYTTGCRPGDGRAPGFEWWLETMNKSLEKMLVTGERPVAVRAASRRTAVAPLLVTGWGQGEPYNNLCPEYTENGTKARYVTGCVATSMAQVMYYHKYPVKGTGSTVYRFNTGDGTITLGADFGATTYDWDNMLGNYSDMPYSETQAEAVATLMYHCGVSVQMQYSKDGSGALSNRACKALKNYFNYSSGIRCMQRDYYNVEEWMQIVYREIDAGCPVIYGGVTASGAGHSFVLDGYDEDGLVSVNWGWNGLDNGYFDIASLNSYSENQDMVIVRTADDAGFTGTYRSQWGLYQSVAVTNSGKTLSLAGNSLVCFDVDEFCGTVAFVAENLGDGGISSLKVLEDNSDIYTYGTGFTYDAATISVASLPDGEYRLYFATMSDEETEWQPVRSKEGVRNSCLLAVSGNDVTLTPETSSAWTAVEVMHAPAGTGTGGGICTLDGRYVGSDIGRLPCGVYIADGRKIMKR